jgi:hypothetical protein
MRRGFLLGVAMTLAATWYAGDVMARRILEERA